MNQPQNGSEKQKQQKKINKINKSGEKIMNNSVFKKNIAENKNNSFYKRRKPTTNSSKNKLNLSFERSEISKQINN